MDDLYLELSLLGELEFVCDCDGELELFIKGSLYSPLPFRSAPCYLGPKFKYQCCSLDIRLLLVGEDHTTTDREGDA